MWRGWELEKKLMTRTNLDEVELKYSFKVELPDDIAAMIDELRKLRLLEKRVRQTSRRQSHWVGQSLRALEEVG